MAEILVRDIDPKVVQRLKARAREHGRSLQKEVKLILEESAPATRSEILALLNNWRDRLSGRTFTDSADLIREDRER